MIVKISEIEILSTDILQKMGFSKNDASLVTKNIIEGELVGKKSHGLIRLLHIKKSVDNGKVNVKGKSRVLKESDTLIHIDGKHKPGFIVYYESLDMAIVKVKKSGIVSVGLKDLDVTGYIGSYARIAAENDLIFIGFNNSPGGLVPYGSTEAIWGTNPLTIGVPTGKSPAVLDMASSMTTWGDLMVSKNEGKKIKEGVAIDSKGNTTTNPENAMEGGILPFGGHKGSGIAFMVEMLAGALTGSMVGDAVKGGWGSFYILINPASFRPLKHFKRDADLAISRLKASKKMKGVNEIYYPGEQSHKLRQGNLKAGTIDVSDKLFQQINELK
jgi:LDH2 family malate/lactate/ureidoglycolate dehydrogenase